MKGLAPLKTDRLETELEAALTAMINQVRRAIAAEVLPRIPELMTAHQMPRFDAADDGQARLHGLRLEWLELESEKVARQLELFGGQVIELSARSVERQIVAGTPASKQQRLKRLGLDTLEPWMTRAAQKWAWLNAELITSIPGELIGDVHGRILQGIRDGARPETVADEMRDWLEAPPARLQLIARDQVGKLQSDIIAGRQKELGIESYWWETANDRRVVGRPGGLYPKGSFKHQDHWIRRGRLFVADEGPPLVELVGTRRIVHDDWTDGHPGQGIQCRCWRRPNLDGLLRRL